ncbi:MAG: hypothetical protein AAFR73_12795 [Pseudomonadota bacterium]
MKLEDDYRLLEHLIERYGEPLAQAISEEIARAEGRDTPAALARSVGMVGIHAA